MIINYTVQYSGTIEVPNSEWDQQTRIDYADDLRAFAFTCAQEERGIWQGLSIQDIEDQP